MAIEPSAIGFTEHTEAKSGEPHTVSRSLGKAISRAGGHECLACPLRRTYAPIDLSDQGVTARHPEKLGRAHAVPECSYLSKPTVLRRLSLSSSHGTRSDQKAWRSVSAGCPVLATGSMHARLTASKSGVASRLMVSGDPQFLHLFRCTWSELLNLCRSPPLVHRNPDFGKMESVTNAAPWSRRQMEQWQ